MRQPRTIIPGQHYHVISRLTEGSWLIHDDDDRACYRRLLGSALEDTDWIAIAYAIMSNHLHLLLRAGRSAAEHWLKACHAPFAVEINRRRGRIGHVFADRPDFWHVRDHQFARVLAYIHNNPVRAGVVDGAVASTWTSHQSYVLGRAPEWLRCDYGMGLCGFDGVDRAARFDLWVLAEAHSPTPNFSDVLGRRTRRQARELGSLEVGTPTLAPDAEYPLVARPSARLHVPGMALLEWLSNRCGVPMGLMCSRSRLAEPKRARRLAFRLGRALGVSIAALADMIGISRQVGSRHARSLAPEDEPVLARLLPDIRRHFDRLRAPAARR